MRDSVLYGDALVEAEERDYSFHHMRERQVGQDMVILCNFEVLVTVESGHTGQHVPMTQKNALRWTSCPTGVRKGIDVIIVRLNLLQIDIHSLSLLD